MPKRYQLTWQSSTRRWRKKHLGKSYYFPLEPGETKESSYSRCLIAWKEKLSQIGQNSQQQQDWKRFLRAIGTLQRWAKDRDDPQDWESLEHARKVALEASGQNLPMPPLDGDIADLGGLSAIVPAFTPVRPWNRPDALDGSKSLRGAIDSYLATKRTQAASGALSEGRLDALQRYLRHFADFAKPGLDISKVDGQVLVAYHDHLANTIIGGKFSRSYAQGYMIAVRQFLRWCWETSRIESLPRNFGSAQLRIQVHTTEVKTIPVELLKQLLAASGRIRLYLLLMANCGYTSQDISDLAPKEVNWTQGRITRKRSKSNHAEGAPVVSYLLWQPTLEMLQQHRSRSKDRLLLTRFGKPLKTECVKNGVYTKSDTIRSSYYRLVEKMQLKSHPLPKQIRKTGASLISGQFGEDVAGVYLGHAPRGIAQKHYLRVSQDRIDAAVTWLGEQLL